jgi:hypothetical protein
MQDFFSWTLHRNGLERCVIKYLASLESLVVILLKFHNR